MKIRTGSLVGACDGCVRNGLPNANRCHSCTVETSQPSEYEKEDTKDDYIDAAAELVANGGSTHGVLDLLRKAKECKR